MSRNQHTELREAIARQQAENIKLRAEIELLRAALQEIADMGTLEYAAKAVVTARRALEPKP
jgi:hypothetical protein